MKSLKITSSLEEVWPWKSKLMSSTRWVLSCGTIYYAVQGGSTFWVCGWNPKVWPFKSKLLSSTFLWCCLLCCTSCLHNFESVDEILKSDRSNESYRVVLSFLKNLIKIPGFSATFSMTCKCFPWPKFGLSFSKLSYCFIIHDKTTVNVSSSINFNFHDFPWDTLNFHDFPDPENEIIKFYDFPGFPYKPSST